MCLRCLMLYCSSILYFLAFPFDASGYADECWHCYSVKDGTCQDPYKGRFEPNSTILKLDCSHDMAHAFSSNVIYILSHASNAVDLGSNLSRKWDEIRLSPSHFECCKTQLDVVDMKGAHSSYVVRGCCTAAQIYKQCEEVEQICQEMSKEGKESNGTTNQSSCKVEHCSSCLTDDCNSASKVKTNVGTLISIGIFILLS